MAPSNHVMLLDPNDHAHLVPFLAAIHANCITADNVIASFRPPLSTDKLLRYWRERMGDITHHKCAIFIYLAEEPNQGRIKGQDLKGVVMMKFREGDTGAHRGHVEGLMVHPNWRKRGAGRALMEALETNALKAGRTLLTLEAERGSDGASALKKFGYLECGVIPDDAQSPAGGLKDTTICYKRLASS